MAYTPGRYTGDGTTRIFSVPFQYFDKTHIKVYLNDVATTAFSWLNDTQVQLNVAPGVGVSVEVVRDTPIDSAFVTFEGVPALDPKDMDKGGKQLLYALQEMKDNLEDGLVDIQEAKVAAAASASSASASASSASASASSASASASSAGAAAVPWVDDRAYATLAEADAVATAASKLLVISKEWTTVPADMNASIKVIAGGAFNNAGPLHFNGSFSIDGKFLVFKGVGTVTGLKEACPEWWGATNGADNTAPFIKARDAAPVVILSDPTFTVNANTSANGRTLIGAPTVLTNYMKNIGEQRGIIFRSNDGVSPTTTDINPAFRASHIPVEEDNSPKVFERVDANTYCVYLPKPNGGYALLEYKNNVTTITDSLATTYSDITRFRLTSVYHVLEVYGAVTTPTGTSGAWSTLIFNNQGDQPVSNAGRYLTGFSSNVSGAYKEYTVKPVNGKIRVAFVATPGSCEAITIHVDGALKATVDMKRTSSVVEVVELCQIYSTADDGTVVVKITNGATGNCNLVGVNYFKLKDWQGEVPDAIGYLRHTTNYVSYLTQNSGNDNVIKEYESGKYGLSYHGGETSISATFYVDNVATALASNGSFAIGRNVRFEQTCAVDWGVGGGAVRSTDYFGLGSTTREFQFVGNVNVTELYSGMFGCPQSFTKVVFPQTKDLTDSVTYPNMARIPLGIGNSVVLENPTTKQRIGLDFTLFTQDENRYGSVHVWKVDASYHKIYYSPIHSGYRNYTQFGSRQTQRFW